MTALRVELRGKVFPPVGAAPARRALGSVVFSVRAGERVAIVGPSGCGKTTLLNLVAGLDPDFEGRIERPAPPIGYVFQEPRLLPWRTVADNLRFVLGDVPDADARIARALAEVELPDVAPVYASRLSLGMARRVALARAIVVRPSLVLLDEPFVSLDQPTGERLRLLVLELLEKHGITALLVTHDLREAVMLAERILVFSASPGRLLGELPVALEPAARRDPAEVDALHRELREAARALVERAAEQPA
ncbi:MAG: ABC transporter ATP-binding protein [Geminicoccaceae bacterium]